VKRYYDQSQVSWIMIVIMVASTIAMVVTLWGQDDQTSGYVTIAVTVFILLLLCRMRVTVDKTNLKIRFLTGLPRATIPITNIKSVETYHGKMRSGMGLKLKPSHGQYHISGAGGVVVMRLEGAPLVISSPEPKRLKSALDKACAKIKE
jgi:hypothetical protein